MLSLLVKEGVKRDHIGACQDLLHRLALSASDLLTAVFGVHSTKSELRALFSEINQWQQ